MTELKIGDTAPDFSVKIAESTPLPLKVLKGRYVVLYFYPKDNTPGCTTQAIGFNDLSDEFESLNAEIIGVSKDDIKSHNKFREKYGLVFALGSDVDGSICNDYGVWGEKSMFGKKYMGIKRQTFLIDPSGKIAYIWHKVSVKNHADEVMDKIKEISSVSK